MLRIKIRDWCMNVSFIINDTSLIYLPFFLFLLVIFTPPWQESNRINTRQEELSLADISTKTISELDKEGDELLAEFASVSSSTKPERYIEMRERCMLAEAMLRKYENTHKRWGNPELQTLTRVEGKINNAHNQIGMLLSTYQELFGRDIMAAINTKWNKEHPRLPWSPSVPNNLWMLFCTAYVESILVMVLFFVLRLYRMNFVVWVEIWRLIPAACFWPITIFLYPHKINAKRQLQQAVEVISYAISAVMSLFTGGIMPVVAKAQTNPETTKKSRSETKSTYHWGSEFYPLTSGYDKGLMVSPWYNGSQVFGQIQTSEFGFIEIGRYKSQLFTNNGLDIATQSAPYAKIHTEIGGSPSGLFVHIGPIIQVSKLPVIGKRLKNILPSLGVGRFYTIRGPGTPAETFVSWASKEIALPKKLSISTEGFMRFRPNGYSTVGQPQLLLGKHNSKWKLAFEAWVIGTKITQRFGVQYSH